jgi:hypothetical protein
MTDFSGPEQAALRYMYHADNALHQGELRSEARDYLEQYIREHGIPDENGHIVWEFDVPVTVDDHKHGLVTYSGLKLQRRVSEYMDEEKAMEIIDKYSLWAECTEEEIVRHVDYDALYAQNQLGVISDEEIDSLLSFDVSYALTKVKA